MAIAREEAPLAADADLSLKLLYGDENLADEYWPGWGCESSNLTKENGVQIGD